MALILEEWINLKASEASCASLEVVKGEEQKRFMIAEAQTKLEFASCHPFLKVFSKHWYIYHSPNSSLRVFVFFLTIVNNNSML